MADAYLNEQIRIRARNLHYERGMEPMPFMQPGWPSLTAGIEWDEDGHRFITRDGIANLVYAIALSAFDQMDGETFREFQAKTLADPNAPRWIRP